MKKLALLLGMAYTLAVPAQTEIDTLWKEQINAVFDGLDKTKVPHGILLDYAIEFTNVPAYNGTLTDSTYINTAVLGNIYKTLFMSRVTPEVQHFPTLEDLAATWVTYRNNYNPSDKNTLVLAGLYYTYARLDSAALNTGRITVHNNTYADTHSNGIWQNPYETLQTIAFAPPVARYNQHHFAVVLPQALWLGNSTGNVQSIAINFNDGTGYHPMAFNQKTYANYTQNGVYSWTFKTTLTDGTLLYTQTKINIDAPETPVAKAAAIPYALPSPNAFETNVLIPGPDNGLPLAYNGAVLRIDYAPAHNGQLIKPFIVAEGFDAGSILTPEIAGGDRTLNDDFLDDLDDAFPSLLNNLLTGATQEYDIVYIDWQNGTNSIQHNSEVLKNVLAWVNAKKQQAGSTEQNVLLGQSMGGVIGRYTLATMETDGIPHDVRLFVAHDAPMQGANMPLSIQHFVRHAYDQYINAPLLYLLGEMVLPTILNLQDLMGITILGDAFPSSVSAYLTLLDTPASLQLNYYYVTLSGEVSTDFHDAWQQEFDAAGYPAQCRNIALSNGNECAPDHGFAPGANFISLHDSNNPKFWGDMLHLLATTFGGILIGDPELFYLGLLPGSSEYFFDLDLHANPDINDTNRQVYWGKIRYEKKLFWVVPISHTITDRAKTAPESTLPFDTYSGGYYDLKQAIGDFSDLLPSNIIVNSRYGFIPVVSALDIKRNSSEILPEDYLKNYSGGQTPESALSSGFDNFIVDYLKNTSPTNNKHISFQTRNGNWLANELNEAENLITDCAAFCTSTTISGSDVILLSETYSLPGALTPNWYIASGGSLVNMSSNGTAITLTRTSPNQGGAVILKASVSNSDCGNRVFTKNIWVGKPSFTLTFMPDNNYVHITMAGKNGADLQAQGITDITWEKLSGSGECFADLAPVDHYALASGDCINWTLQIKVSATNAAGTTTTYSNVAPPAVECDDTFSLAKNPVATGSTVAKAVIEPCDKEEYPVTKSSGKPQQYTIAVYNLYGKKIYNKTQPQTHFALGQLKKGCYMVRFQSPKGRTTIKKLIVK